MAENSDKQKHLKRIPHRKRKMVQPDPDLREFAEEWCKVNKQSFSSLINELLRLYRDEL